MKLQFPTSQWLRNTLPSTTLLGTTLLFGISLFGISLFGIAPAAKAQIAEPNTREFRQIEQPLGLKVGVAAAGAGLIGLELWWFLFSKNKAQTAQVSEGVQSVDTTVE
ncbi:MAG: hypothetical protein HLUCCA11_16870 [Phormidesmis priestleyi Ana]|uniref:Uncharacterized protein n=1 Tax=Phormidesmis priestleyi Ana TaxID=1666911 RepID=A0A0P8DCT0_9CYAN|nr:MAG: hypothetical protein HLUCCA11_16870 [Phormidesmis priestleyi Ana]